MEECEEREERERGEMGRERDYAGLTIQCW